MNIDRFFELLLTFGVPIIALVGVWWQVNQNRKINESNLKFQKELQEDNRKFQEKLNIENNGLMSEWNQKKIDADIISKSRMQWIGETKSLTSDFMNDSAFLLATITLFCEKSWQVEKYIEEHNRLGRENKTPPNKKKYEDLGKLIDIVDQQQVNNSDALNKYQEKVHRNRLLIKLQFSDNVENNLIVEKVEKITEDIRSFALIIGWSQFSSFAEKEDLVNKSRKLREDKQNEIEELVNILRDYYKKEWEKVKNGE